MATDNHEDCPACELNEKVAEEIRGWLVAVWDDGWDESATDAAVADLAARVVTIARGFS